MSEVELQDHAGYGHDETNRLEGWLERVVRGADLDGSLTARLATDEEVRRWNRELRGRDAATDVLSFPGEATVEGPEIGDVLVALPVARRQAAEAGHALERELQELLLHGLLHCLGYDHEEDAGEMEALELQWRERWIDGE